MARVRRAAEAAHRQTLNVPILATRRRMSPAAARRVRAPAAWRLAREQTESQWRGVWARGAGRGSFGRRHIAAGAIARRCFLAPRLSRRWLRSRFGTTWIFRRGLVAAEQETAIVRRGM